MANTMNSVQRLRGLRHGTMPFGPLLPAIVLIFGLLGTLAIAAIGVRELGAQSDRQAAMTSRLLSETLAQRLSATDERDHADLIQRAAEASGAEIVLVHRTGKVVVDGALSPPTTPGASQLLVVGQGQTQTGLGRVRFSTASLGPPFGDLSVISFVPAPKRPIATSSLVRSVAVYSSILLFVAALMALALARDVRSDVVYLTSRIGAMARTEADPVGEAIPVRTIDDVGAMTHAFNDLVRRFTRAEESYRDDLRVALSIERDKSAFLAALSHELKTPLNVILGFADVLLAEVEGPLTEEARECLMTIKGSGTHLKALIKDILDLSALESGELTLARGLTNVFSVAEDVLAEHRVAAKDKELELKLSGETAMAFADPIRVRQMIGNLVSNAVKFTQRGHVEVRVEQQGDDTAITVSDTGPGIAAGDQNAIFEDFSQVGDLKARGAGTGLGLAITRRLVRMHGGKIWLESELGEGATFTIILPATKREGLPSGRISSLPAPPNSTESV